MYLKTQLAAAFFIVGMALMAKNNPTKPNIEFYDLKNDPTEMNNLIKDQSTLIQFNIKELNQKIILKMKASNDPVVDLIKN